MMPKKTKLFRLSLSLSLSQPPLPPQKTKHIHIWHHLLFGIKHKGIKGFKQNLWRDIHLSGADPGFFSGGVNDGRVQRAPLAPAPTGV